jgi:ABC-type sugar transport system permease subunit
MVRRGPGLARHRVATVGFLSPALLLILVFVAVPMAMTLWISLHRWSMLTPISQMKWVGLENYQAVLTDSTHLTAFRNTVVYVALSAAITIPLAVLLALLLYFPKLRGRGLVRVILFATYVVPTVAIVIVWSNLYAPSYGPIDAALSAVGSPHPDGSATPAAH